MTGHRPHPVNGLHVGFSAQTGQQVCWTALGGLEALRRRQNIVTKVMWAKKFVSP